MGSYLYFSAAGAGGVELYRYDGSSADIALVADINANGDSSPKDFAVFKSKLYFSADDGSHGRELWCYDGKNAPAMVADLQPGTQSSNPRYLAVFANKLYFSADDGKSGDELWAYDGANPPTLQADINAGSASAHPCGLTVYQGRLYFAADDGIHGTRLWSYDGAGTADLVTLECAPNIADDATAYQDNADGMQFYVFAGKLYFPATGPSGSCEPYSYEAAGGKVAMLKDINTNDGGANKSSNPAFFVEFNHVLYFTATDGGTPGVGHGPELWRSDGTTAGTLLAVDLEKGPAGASGGRPSDTVVYQGKLVFDNFEHYNRGRELYTFDGDVGGMVADINPSGGSNPDDLCVFGGAVYFSASDGVHGRQLWKYKE